jgi:hypothetical protein
MRKLRASIFLARHKQVAAALATSVFESTERAPPMRQTAKSGVCVRARDKISRRCIAFAVRLGIKNLIIRSGAVFNSAR